MARNWLSGPHAFILCSPGAPACDTTAVAEHIGNSGFVGAWIHAALWQRTPGCGRWPLDQVRELSTKLNRAGVVPMAHFWVNKDHASEHPQHLHECIELCNELGISRGAYGDAADQIKLGHRWQPVNIVEYYRRLREGLRNHNLTATFCDKEASGLCNRIGTQDVDWRLTPQQRIDDLLARARAYDVLYRRPDKTPIHRYVTCDIGWLMLVESACGAWIEPQEFARLYRHLYFGIAACGFTASPNVQAHYHQWEQLSSSHQRILASINAAIVEERWLSEQNGTRYEEGPAVAIDDPMSADSAGAVRKRTADTAVAPGKEHVK